MKKPNILITNDDGIHAAGLRHLWKVLQPIANLTIVAPSEEQSATSLSITIRHPLHIKKKDHFPHTNAWSVSGTPADCVKLALSVILDSPPDLIVAGINQGSNSGRNVLYSGTVAGVIEGVMHDIPGIAFSCWDYKNPDYAATEKYIPSILHHVLEHPLPKGTLLNVNFPSKHANAIQGIKLTKHGKEFWAENPDKRVHPADDSEYYWLGSQLAEYSEDEDCDVTWLRKGYIAAVPIHIGELTDHRHLSQRKASFDSLF